MRRALHSISVVGLVPIGIVACVPDTAGPSPSVICGDPDPKRSLAIDLTTSAATIK
jgi:hypothetical protein